MAAEKVKKQAFMREIRGLKYKN